MMPIQRSGRVVVLADGRACVPACVPYVGPPRPPSANLYVWCMGSPEIPPCRPLQILAGLVEERGIEVLFKTNPAACAVLSFIVRTGNTFLGS